MTNREALQQVQRGVYDALEVQARLDHGEWAGEVLRWAYRGRTVGLGIVNGLFLVEDRGSVATLFDGLRRACDPDEPAPAADAIVGLLRQPANVVPSGRWPKADGDRRVV
ncbi:MAG TPA: hypothetical protein VHS78_11680 [Candidatus Elarobacter sp.]|jgi:hypothetical protein|nr:hypothetical protein [Candidatus Elarobacter sp.]